MGKKPAFSSGSVSNSDKIDGKPIVLLTEVECQAYLKQAIDMKLIDTLNEALG